MGQHPVNQEWDCIINDDTASSRFAKFTNIRLGQCWNWTGSGRERYGTIRINGKTLSAHRVSYCLFVGPIPKNLMILHSCDNKSCVNPNHLSVGTHEENMRQVKERITKQYSDICKRGHSDWTSNGKNRTCRICRIEREQQTRRGI